MNRLFNKKGCNQRKKVDNDIFFPCVKYIEQWFTLNIFLVKKSRIHFTTASRIRRGMFAEKLVFHKKNYIDQLCREASFTHNK